MRTIKFRVWDKESEILYEPFELQEAFGFVQSFYGQFKDNENIVLMQYTGLKDKNGVEIYEGDIIKRIKPDFPNRDLKAVEWIVQRSVNGWNIARGELWQVIGNVFENPELI